MFSDVIELIRQIQRDKLSRNLKCKTCISLLVNKDIHIDEQKFLAKKKLRDFLEEDNAAKVLLLSGNNASGKSFFIKYYAKYFWEMYHFRRICRIPLWLKLTNLERTDGGKIEEGIIEQYLRKIDLDNSAINECKSFKWCLFLDDLDKLSDKYNLYKDFNQWDIKIIIGCSTQAIVLVDDYQELFISIDRNSFSQNNWLQTLMLEPFNNMQILKFTALKTSEVNLQELQAALRQILGLNKLISNHFMLEKTLEVMPILLDEYISYLEWEKDELVIPNKASLLSHSFKQEFITYLQDLALTILLKREEYKNRRTDLGQLHYNPQEKNNSWHNFFIDDRKYKNCRHSNYHSLVIHTAQRTQKKVYYYSFLYSLLEYWVVRAIEYQCRQYYQYDEETQLGCWNTEALYNIGLNQKLLNDETDLLDLLIQCIHIGAISKQALLELIINSRDRHDITIAAANAATLLNHAGFNFSGMDFQKVKIIGADLRGSFFHKSNLKEADLRYTHLGNSDLSEACLTRANMEGVNFGQWPVLLKHECPVTSIAFSPDSQYVVSGGGDSILRLWRIEDNICHRTFEGHIHNIKSVAFSPDNQYLISGGDDNTVRLWNVKEGTCGKIFKWHTHGIWDSEPKSISSVTFNPNSQYMAWGDMGGVVQLWSVKNSSFKVSLKHTHSIRSVVFSPNNQYLASGGDDNVVRVWNCVVISSISLKFALYGHTQSIKSIVFSPDCRYLASGSEDKTIWLWDVKKGTSDKIFEGHTSKILSLVFSPNNPYLASGSADNTIRLWNVKKGTCDKIFKVHTDWVQSVAFSPDGQYLCSGGADNRMNLWRIHQVAVRLEVKLLWMTQSCLMASGTDLTDTTGLSAVNVELLKKYGAINIPKATKSTFLTLTRLQQRLCYERDNGRMLNQQQQFTSLLARYRHDRTKITSANWQLVYCSKADKYYWILEGINEYGRICKLVVTNSQNPEWQIEDRTKEQIKRLLADSYVQVWPITVQFANQYLLHVAKRRRQTEHNQESFLRTALRGLDKHTQLSCNKWRLYAVHKSLSGMNKNTCPKSIPGCTISYYRRNTLQGVKIQLDSSYPEDCYEALAKALSNCYHVHELDLSQNRLDDLITTLLSQLAEKFTRLQILRLSHNRISKDGLITLLEQSAKYPNISQILLDYNHISFNAYYAKRFRELLEKTNLINLDLSMNYIPKGENIEAIIIVNKYLVVYDKASLNAEFGEEDRIFCKSMFFASSKLNSLFLQSIPSCLDSDKEISLHQGVVSLFANRGIPLLNEHAFLVLEGVRNFGQRYLISGEIFNDKGKVKAIIRYIIPDDLSRRTNGLTNVYKDCVQVSRKQLKALIKNMIDFRKQEGNVQFSLTPANDDQYSYSCIKWAREMLYKAGICDDPRLKRWIPSMEVSGQSFISNLLGR